MHARLTTIEATPAALPAAIQRVRDTVPQAEQIEGFRGVYALSDATSGRLVIVTLWDTEAAMFASAAAGQTLGEQIAQAAGASGTPTVQSFEVAVAPDLEGQRLAAAVTQAAHELEGRVRRVASSDEVTRLTRQVEGSLQQLVEWARHRGTPPPGGPPTSSA